MTLRIAESTNEALHIASSDASWTHCKRRVANFTMIPLSAFGRTGDVSWCPACLKALDAIESGPRKAGKRWPTLPQELVDKACELIAGGMSQTAAANALGVTQSSISRALKREAATT